MGDGGRLESILDRVENGRLGISSRTWSTALRDRRRQSVRPIDGPKKTHPVQRDVGPCRGGIRRPETQKRKME
jgi:hypothetical protein